MSAEDEPVASTDDVGERIDLTDDREVDLRDGASAPSEPLHGGTRDQAAVLRDEGAGLRDRAADLRDQAAFLRDEAAEVRDQGDGSFDAESVWRDRAADRRDGHADRRDHGADRRDRDADRAEAEATEGAVSSDDHGSDARGSATAERRDAGRDRAAVAREKATAGRDRLASSLDRGASAGDRARAAADRGASSEDRTVAAEFLDLVSLDGLTGAYIRSAGLAEVERDFSRTKRAGQPFTVAFVDVDGLKEVNDRGGHAAGDRLLREVVQTLRDTLRSYDLIVRYGGDEFVSAVSGMTMTDVAARMALVNDSLAAHSQGHGSVSIGLAEYMADDSIESLVARADAALYEERSRRGTAR